LDLEDARVSATGEAYFQLRVAELIAERWPGLLELVCQAVDLEQALVVDAELERRANGAVAAAVIPRPSTPTGTLATRSDTREAQRTAGVSRRVDLQPLVS
jgi:hypothetical protein